MARLREPRSGRVMKVFGSQPALQVYTANYLSTGKLHLLFSTISSLVYRSFVAQSAVFCYVEVWVLRYTYQVTCGTNLLKELKNVVCFGLFGFACGIPESFHRGSGRLNECAKNQKNGL